MLAALVLLNAEHTLLTKIADRDVAESSGIATSALEPGQFWTHNDSGSKAVLYRFDTDGEVTAKVQVRGAKTVDWEDMASGRGAANILFVADIGDNAAKRKSVVIYALPEPKKSGTVDVGARYELIYPDGARNAESFGVDPVTGTFYIVEKANGISGVYALADPQPGKSTLRRMGSITVGSMIPFSRLTTGMAFAPNGKQVVVRTYLGAFMFAVPARGREWWESTPVRVNLRAERQGEAICFSRDGKWLVTTSEGSPCEVSRIELGK